MRVEYFLRFSGVSASQLFDEFVSNRCRVKLLGSLLIVEGLCSTADPEDKARNYAAALRDQLGPFQMLTPEEYGRLPAECIVVTGLREQDRKRQRECLREARHQALGEVTPKLSQAYDYFDAKGVNGVTYKRDDFCYAHRGEIIRLALNPKKLKAYPTKYSQRTATVKLSLTVPRSAVQTEVVTVDDIASFAKVRKVKSTAMTLTIKENIFKVGVQRIIGQEGTFKDWGGETSDLFSTRLKVDVKRRAAAFAFKGKGLTGLLTPARMGKNGDQIQRLFVEDADVFLLQYGGEIANSVIQQMATYAQAKSMATGRLIRYGVLDGADSARLVAAYPRAFAEERNVSPQVTPGACAQPRPAIPGPPRFGGLQGSAQVRQAPLSPTRQAVAQAADGSECSAR